MKFEISSKNSYNLPCVDFRICILSRPSNPRDLLSKCTLSTSFWVAPHMLKYIMIHSYEQGYWNTVLRWGCTNVTPCGSSLRHSLEASNGLDQSSYMCGSNKKSFEEKIFFWWVLGHLKVEKVWFSGPQKTRKFHTFSSLAGRRVENTVLFWLHLIRLTPSFHLRRHSPSESVWVTNGTPKRDFFYTPPPPQDSISISMFIL